MTVHAVEAWTVEPVTAYVHEAGARLVLLMTPAGQVLAQYGFTRAVDVMSAAALGAAIMASTTELARQLGRPPFAALNHQGHRGSRPAADRSSRSSCTTSTFRPSGWCSYSLSNWRPTCARRAPRRGCPSRCWRPTSSAS